MHLCFCEINQVDLSTYRNLKRVEPSSDHICKWIHAYFITYGRPAEITVINFHSAMILTFTKGLNFGEYLRSWAHWLSQCCLSPMNMTALGEATHWSDLTDVRVFFPDAWPNEPSATMETQSMMSLSYCINFWLLTVGSLTQLPLSLLLLSLSWQFTMQESFPLSTILWFMSNHILFISAVNYWLRSYFGL